jgi:hypothetical protein
MTFTNYYYLLSIIEYFGGIIGHKYKEINMIPYLQKGFYYFGFLNVALGNPILMGCLNAE